MADYDTLSINGNSFVDESIALSACQTDWFHKDIHES